MKLLQDSARTQILPQQFDLPLFWLKLLKAALRHEILLLNTLLHISKNVDIFIEPRFTYFKKVKLLVSFNIQNSKVSKVFFNGLIQTPKRIQRLFL